MWADVGVGLAYIETDTAFANKITFTIAGIQKRTDTADNPTVSVLVLIKVFLIIYKICRDAFFCRFL